MSNAIVIASIVLFVLLLLKVPVFAAVLSGPVVYFLLTPKVNAQIFAQRVIAGCESIPMLAIPFFVCAGIFMNYSGVTKRIMNFCEAVTGRMIGGLAQVNILLSTLMGGLSGSNLADAAMEAKMLVPTMVEKGFSLEFSTVVTAFSAMITPLIPPGIALILYGSIANVSVGKLFMAGLGIGILLCVSEMVLVYVISKKRGYMPIRENRISGKDFFLALKGAVLPLCLPIIIIGGIRIGIFTPTEAGSAAIVYALFLGILYHEMTIKDFLAGIKETITTTSSIIIIIGSASAYSWILTKEQIPQKLTQSILGVIDNKYIFLIIVNILLLIVAVSVEGNVSMIVLVPLLAPVAMAYGINEIQFAVIFIFNSAIGDLTPPFGTLMFVSCGVTKCNMKKFVKEGIPFYMLLLFWLVLITYCPIFSTGIVNLLY